jgi:pimeloyl-ACP methyl ester carboxylesterase
VLVVLELRSIDVNVNITRRQAIGLVAAAPVLLSEPSRARSRGVDETGFARIGGIDQWIGIQGSAARNPVILYLHGGPGNAESPFLNEFLPWEEQFTVANWDQRGSGKTYGRNGPSTPGMATPEMALRQLTEDAVEVAAYVSQRLAKRKIILVGHSWGGVLGLHVIKRRPDLFSAFVGTGFVVSWKRALQDLEQWARQQAMSARDETTLRLLDDAAQLPLDDPRRRDAASKYLLAPDDQEYFRKHQAFFGPPSVPTEGDVGDWVAGRNFTVPKLVAIVTSFDARTLGLDFSLPFFVIQGRDDHIVSVREAEEYVDAIHAPRKAFVPINGGHLACFTNATGFIDALRQYVRPLVT